MGDTVVALELDMVHDTVRREISRRIPANGLTSETDIEGVGLGLVLAGHTRFEGQSLSDLRDFYGELLCIVPTHDLFA